MRLREKVDGFLVLSIYFVPFLILLSLILNSTLFFVGSFGRSAF